MCQGLPYWASGLPPVIQPCRSYDIECTSFEDPQQFNYYVDYTDCFGISRRQQVGIGLPFPPRKVTICSSTTPIPGDNFPGPTPPPVNVTLKGNCSDGVAPSIPCGDDYIYRGPFPYNDKPFPDETDVAVSPSLGSITVSSIYDVQIKKIVCINPLGEVEADTGYFVSNSATGNQQQILNDYLISKGLPTETISIQPLSTPMSRTFNKTSSYSILNVKAYLVPNPNYTFGESSYWYRVSCPPEESKYRVTLSLAYVMSSGSVLYDITLGDDISTPSNSWGVDGTLTPIPDATIMPFNVTVNSGNRSKSGSFSVTPKSGQTLAYANGTLFGVAGDVPLIINLDYYP